MRLHLIITATLFLGSCATYTPPPEAFPPDYTGPAYLEASPWATVVGSGSCHYVFVKVMDKEENPLPNQTVVATIDNPTVAWIDKPERVTDEKGLAEFFMVGIGHPGYTYLNFASGEASTSVYVWTRGYSPFGFGR